MEAPRTIAIDFDGTICGFDFPGIGAPKPGVVQALTAFRALGFQVMIYSCRTSNYYKEIFCTPADPDDQMQRQRVKEMIAYLDKHKIPYDVIDDGSKGKPLADYYIDDKGVRFDDNWAEIVDFIKGRCLYVA